MTSTLPLDILQGATFRRTFVWRQPQTPAQKAAGEPGTPYDLSNCRATMQIRKKVNGDVLLEVEDETGINFIAPDPDAQPDPLPWRLQIELSSEQTMLLEYKRTAAYDLYVSFPTGDVLRVIQGDVNISLTVTDPVDA